MAEENRITDAAGDNTHQGTDSSDVFEFSPGNGDDTVTGFNNGADLIDLSDFATISDFSDLTLRTLAKINCSFHLR